MRFQRPEARKVSKVLRVPDGGVRKVSKVPRVLDRGVRKASKVLRVTASKQSQHNRLRHKLRRRKLNQHNKLLGSLRQRSPRLRRQLRRLTRLCSRRSKPKPQQQGPQPRS